MKELERSLKGIDPPGNEWRRITQERLDRLTKPPGSLGRLEELALWYVGVTGKFPPLPLKKAVYTFAGDHGVAGEGVSAYPKSVTGEMVHNFIRGGAAINVLARQAGAEVHVVDMGVDRDFKKLAGLIDRKIAKGTRNMLRGAALGRDEAIRAIHAGIALAHDAARDGVNLIGAGEMGIGNTTSASAITAVLTSSPPARVVGKGTGIDPARLQHKIRVVEKAIALNRPDPEDAVDVLSKLGGFEIGGMAGLIIGAAEKRIPVLLDGFISTAAALLAVRLKAEIRDYLLAGHESAEPGHASALEHLDLRPLLSLNMRLGEGTGAALAVYLVECSIRILTEMATFDEAGVSKREGMA